MNLTREQVRAARALLNIRQEQLAEIAEIGVATVRRFEGGAEVGTSCVDAIRQALERAGVVLLGPEIDPGGSSRGVGVALADV